MVELIGGAVQPDPSVFAFSCLEVGAFRQCTAGDTAVIRPALGVNAELEPVGFGACEILEMKAGNNQVAAPQTETGCPCENRFARDFRTDSDRSRSSALTIKPKIRVLTISCGKHNCVPRFGFSNRSARSFRIRDSEVRGVKHRSEKENYKVGFHAR